MNSPDLDLTHYLRDVLKYFPDLAHDDRYVVPKRLATDVFDIVPYLHPWFVSGYVVGLSQAGQARFDEPPLTPFENAFLDLSL